MKEDRDDTCEWDDFVLSKQCRARRIKDKRNKKDEYHQVRLKLHKSRPRKRITIRDIDNLDEDFFDC